MSGRHPQSNPSCVGTGLSFIRRNVECRITDGAFIFSPICTKYVVKYANPNFVVLLPLMHAHMLVDSVIEEILEVFVVIHGILGFFEYANVHVLSIFDFGG